MIIQKNWPAPEVIEVLRRKEGPATGMARVVVSGAYGFWLKWLVNVGLLKPGKDCHIVDVRVYESHHFTHPTCFNIFYWDIPVFPWLPGALHCLSTPPPPLISGNWIGYYIYTKRS